MMAAVVEAVVAAGREAGGGCTLPDSLKFRCVLGKAPEPLVEPLEPRRRVLEYGW